MEKKTSEQTDHATYYLYYFWNLHYVKIDALTKMTTLCPRVEHHVTAYNLASTPKSTSIIRTQGTRPESHLHDARSPTIEF